MKQLQGKCTPLEVPAVELAQARRLAAGGGGELIRRGAGLSMYDVARACGVHASTVLRWERGERRPHGMPAVLYARLMAELAAANGHGAAR